MKKLWTACLALLGLNAQANELTANTEANLKTIQALINAGSNPAKAHPLEHHFYCFTEGCIERLLAKGTSLGYRAANVGQSEHEGVQYWYGDLVKDTVLDLDLINRENVIMLQLAQDMDADYDGWGTPVVE